MRKTFKLALIVSLCILIAVTAVLTASALSAKNADAGSVGIIGGADGPTAILITETLVFSNPLFYVALVALIAAVVSAIGFIAAKKD